jgi:two-component sensor histidine kinase
MLAHRGEKGVPETHARALARDVVTMPAISGLAAALEKLTAEKPLNQYLLAGVIVALAWLLRELLFVVGANMFAVPFLLAVMIVGLACGFGPGLVAAILATFIPLLHFFGNTAAFFPSTSTNMAVNTVVMGAANLFVAYVAASHRALRKRAVMLALELGHRTKNLLTIVVSIAHRTARGAPDVESYQRALESRLLAMAEAYDLLMKSHWRDTSLRSVVAAAITPFTGGGQIVVQGPDFAISPAAVENLMMALHELLTNSAKYGALSSPDGSISISWRTQGERLQLVWHGRLHTGLPDPARSDAALPPRQGFGTLVLTEIVPRNLQGKAKYEVGPDRVRWELEVPLRAFVSAAESASTAPGREQPA